MGNVDKLKRPRRERLSESGIAAEIEAVGAICTLSAEEITDWTGQLKRGVDSERRLQNLITYWFHQAKVFTRIPVEVKQHEIRAYFKCRLAQGDRPDTIALPSQFHHIDKWLPELSGRLSAI